jgi:hypothetical protein
MGARKTGKIGGWTRIRDEIRKRKRPGCQVEGNVVFGGKSEFVG